MQRREFLRLSVAGAGALALGSLLPACLRRAQEPPSSIPPPFEGLVGKLRTRADPGLAVFPGGSEFVAGTTERVALRLMDPEGRNFESVKTEVYVGSDRAVEGPFEVRFRHFGSVSSHTHEDGTVDVTEGFYEADIPVIATGVVDLAVLAARPSSPKGLFGFAVIEGRSSAKVPAVGQDAVATPTPTEADPKGAAEICTRDPQCPMHTSSLDTALADPRPVVLLIGSPKFCSSGVCGPVIEEVMAVRSSGIDAEFIHVEPYRDAEAVELTPAASAWRLDSEPWTFVIGSNGKVRARFEGAVVAESITRALRDSE